MQPAGGQIEGSSAVTTDLTGSSPKLCSIDKFVSEHLQTLHGNSMTGNAALQATLHVHQLCTGHTWAIRYLPARASIREM